MSFNSYIYKLHFLKLTMQNQQRVVIDKVSPQINCGKFYIKRVVGEIVNVDANILVDGHDLIGASILYKHESETNFHEARMTYLGNDEWNGHFMVEKQGFYSYMVEGWVDHGLNWQYGIERKIEDGQHVNSELLEGAEYIKRFIEDVDNEEKAFLNECLNTFTYSNRYEEGVNFAKSKTLNDIFYKYPVKELLATSSELHVYVDRYKARFSTWYEFFPRSAAEHPGQHGTFKDCERILPRVSEMGFDTLYFPPIHPIGEVNRKGKNNTTNAAEGDVGSPWGIGSQHGGHKAIHPDLGSLDDFKGLINRAAEHGIEIAMDFALQAAPDHPWVKEHPKWFKWRPDGTVQYAENPPKKYQDILPIYWEGSDYKNLWQECLDTLVYWIKLGINIFRVDNPHTKPFHFWNWVISEIKKDYPDVLFLAEAFTKPKVMQQLAKQGFTQSYTYFTWRDSKHEFIEYLTELTKTDQKDYMRPNFWPNTPDINPYHLQGANESKFIQRYALAATLSSNIGIYGPVFEQMISDALPGREEYHNSEKYQITHYDWYKETKLSRIITKINAVRHQQKALQQTNNIEFCDTDNDQLLAFYKWSDHKDNEMLIIISMDHYYTQKGNVRLPIQSLGINPGHRVQLNDLLTGSSYNWHNEWNYVELHPTLPFHIFLLNK